VTVGQLADGFYMDDNCPGIQNNLNDVFETGYSTSEWVTRIGSNLVKEIVKAHCWKIRVTEGSDSSVCFEFIGVKALPNSAWIQSQFVSVSNDLNRTRNSYLALTDTG
jgi:hypothetical protein